MEIWKQVLDIQRTLERRESTVEDQLEIAELALAQDDSSKGLCLGRELGIARRITSEQVLELTTVGRVRHCSVVFSAVGRR